ncbi:MAG: hypothetical protein GYA02_08610, partial [Clostridiaceae bacterium]|nr:hypothetical protein [Clostridiaceae bacterium]
MLARTFKFTPDTPLNTGDKCSVWVSQMVANYADRTMAMEVSTDVEIPEK